MPVLDLDCLNYPREAGSAMRGNGQKHRIRLRIPDSGFESRIWGCVAVQVTSPLCASVSLRMKQG